MTSSSASGGRAGTTTAPDYTDQARHSARRTLTTPDWLPGRRRWLAALAWLLVAAVLFVCYLHISRSEPANSDGAANALQAWDMLHGNLLLHNWWLSDVSFYTTELPEYMLVELVHGLNADVVHVAAALTYTLLVLLAAVLAKGHATGREAVGQDAAGRRHHGGAAARHRHRHPAAVTGPRGQQRAGPAHLAAA